ncbi:MAG: hypothetical protein M0P31_12015 [Solirubrobacteraceae bacterium]|nr:hypothetical protein [Solirubrobacteraceae bacterium]
MLGIAGCALLLTACGSEAPDIEDASDGRPFAVSVTADFEERQELAGTETLRITVRNQDDRTLPDVSVVLDGLQRTIASEDNGAGRIADPRRPIWVVDAPPAGSTTAYVNTWALGPLPQGESKTFRWKLTPVVPGTHDVEWRVSGGVDSDAPVRASRGETEGTFKVRVAETPRSTTVDPDTNRVVPDED